MNIWKNIAMIALMSGASAFGQGGNGAGNGIVNSSLNAGDPIEQEVLPILSNLRDWVNTGAGKKLIGAPNDYTERMQKVLSAGVAIEWMSEKRFVQLYGVEKVCVNLDLRTGYRRHTQKDGMFMMNNPSAFAREEEEWRKSNEKIDRQIKQLGTPYFMQCNRALFPSDREKQYRFLHHEVAGLAGIETNEGSVQSRYFLSDQVSGKLVDVLEKRLPIEQNDSQGLIENGVPILRCEGILQSPRPWWTGKRRKEFVITGFNGGETYISEIVYPLGQGLRDIPKVRIVKLKRGLLFDEINTVHQPIEIFGKTFFFKAVDLSQKRSLAVLTTGYSTFSGISVSCDSLKSKYNATDIDRYRTWIDSLSKKGWIRFTHEEYKSDSNVRMPMKGIPGPPRQTGYIF